MASELWGAPWTAAAVALAGALAFAPSCAAKKSDAPGATGDAQASSSASGDGGSGGSGGTSGTGGAGGAGGAGQGGTLVCPEMPCKLVSPQCGCEAGKRCDLLGKTRSCVAAGSKKKAESCTDDCAAGLRCFSDLTTGANQICSQYCDTDADCDGVGGLCVFTVGGNAGKVCSINCDPVTTAGCKAAGNRCSIYQKSGLLFTECAVAGTKKQGDKCTSGGDCAGGYECFTVNMTSQYCLRWCNAGTGVGCPQGTQCVHLNPAQVIGSVEYGGCLAFGMM